MDSVKQDELSFNVNGLCLRARAWGDSHNPPILALHGWLDNCASFTQLAHYLPEFRLIALDAAGQGLSDHRSADSSYNIWQDADEILQIASQLGLQQLSLLGHSRGAIIASIIAGTFPERIKHLMMIDGLFGTLNQADEAPRQLANAILDKAKLRSRVRRVYPDLVTMAAQRMKGAMPLSAQAAMLITVRGSHKVDNGYCWNFDPRLRAASELRLTETQSRAFLKRITAKTHLYLAQDGIINHARNCKKYWSDIIGGELFDMPGGHHLHMEQQAALIAEKVKNLMRQA